MNISFDEMLDISGMMEHILEDDTTLPQDTEQDDECTQPHSGSIDSP